MKGTVLASSLPSDPHNPSALDTSAARTWDAAFNDFVTEPDAGHSGAEQTDESTVKQGPKSGGTISATSSMGEPPQPQTPGQTLPP